MSVYGDGMVTVCLDSRGRRDARETSSVISGFSATRTATGEQRRRVVTDRRYLLTADDGRAFPFAIPFDSIRYANRFESIRFVKNRPFDSLVPCSFCTK